MTPTREKVIWELCANNDKDDLADRLITLFTEALQVPDKDGQSFEAYAEQDKIAGNEP